MAPLRAFSVEQVMTAAKSGLKALATVSQKV